MAPVTNLVALPPPPPPPGLIKALERLLEDAKAGDIRILAGVVLGRGGVAREIVIGDREPERVIGAISIMQHGLLVDAAKDMR